MTRSPVADPPPSGGDNAFLTDSDGIEALFGHSARFYVPLLRQIMPRVFRVQYDFEDTPTYERKLRDGTYTCADGNRVYWRDFLFLAHLVVSASLHRTCRLVDASVRERRASSLPGWASCTRALLEAIGDANTTLRPLLSLLPEKHHSIRRCLEGREDQIIMFSSEVEDLMTHFTHARRLAKGEKQDLPSSHQAKPATEYIRELAAYGISDVPELYSELCAFSHPAADSVKYLFANTGEGTVFRIDPFADQRAIDSLVAAHRAVFENLLLVAANPILLILRVFHAFRLFPNIPELRDVNFSAIPAWAAIERDLKRR